MTTRKRPSARKTESPLPVSNALWLEEIARAYCDAAEAIPFGGFVGADMGERDLFHLAPAVCLKFRGIKPSRGLLARARDAALTSYVTSYVINERRESEVLSVPPLAFAFCYLSAHFGLDLLDERQVSSIMDYADEHRERLAAMIARGRGRRLGA